MKILVVDDQPMLCELLCEYLHEDLHATESAMNGNEALEKFRLGEFALHSTPYLLGGEVPKLLTGASATATKSFSAPICDAAKPGWMVSIRG